MEEPKADKPNRKSRFVGRWEDLRFETREESDAWVTKRRAEPAAFGEKMREEAAAEKARQLAEWDEQDNDEKKS